MVFLVRNLEYRTGNAYNLCFVFSDYKLGARVEICLEALQKEEHLG